MPELFDIWTPCPLFQVLSEGAWGGKDLRVFTEVDFRCNKTFGILVHFLFHSQPPNCDSTWELLLCFYAFFSLMEIKNLAKFHCHSQQHSMLETFEKRQVCFIFGLLCVSFCHNIFSYLVFMHFAPSCVSSWLTLSEFLNMLQQMPDLWCIIA